MCGEECIRCCIEGWKQFFEEAKRGFNPEEIEIHWMEKNIRLLQEIMTFCSSSDPTPPSQITCYAYLCSTLHKARKDFRIL
jgi:hypothetical protein